MTLFRFGDVVLNSQFVYKIATEGTYGDAFYSIVITMSEKDRDGNREEYRREFCDEEGREDAFAELKFDLKVSN